MLKKEDFDWITAGKNLGKSDAEYLEAMKKGYAGYINQIADALGYDITYNSNVRIYSISTKGSGILITTIEMCATEDVDDDYEFCVVNKCKAYNKNEISLISSMLNALTNIKNG